MLECVSLVVFFPVFGGIVVRLGDLYIFLCIFVGWSIYYLCIRRLVSRFVLILFDGAFGVIFCVLWGRTGII